MEKLCKMHMMMYYVGSVSVLIVFQCQRTGFIVLYSLQRKLSSFVEVVEHACGIGNVLKGGFVSNVSNGIDTYSIREPLGVCAGICPSDFPAMIPLWVTLLYTCILFFEFSYALCSRILSL